MPVDEQHSTFFERLAEKQSSQQILIRVGLDPHQFILFVRLFRTLSERGELIGNLGVNRFNISYISLFFAAALLVPWTFAVDSVPAPIYLLTDLLITFALVFLIVVREAGNTLFNPMEASILAHKPIHGSTYAAAKIAHILIAVIYIVLGLNLYPALIGFMNRGAQWYWMVTHLSSALLIGLWTAFTICACYGIVSRFVPASLLKNISIWIQFVAFISFIAIPVFFGSTLLANITAGAGRSQLTWLPLTRFLHLGFLGCSGFVWRPEWHGLVSIALSIIFVWWGLRGFSSTYFSEVVLIAQGWSAGNRGKIGSSGLSSAVLLSLTGSPAGVGILFFVAKMFRRDWQFRRAVFMQTLLPLLTIIGLILGIIRFGMHPPKSGNELFPPYYLPHFMGLITMALCINLPFTDFNKASWIYLTAPLDNIRSLARGVFWGLWIPAVGLPNIALFFLYLYFSHWQQAVFIGLFNVIVVSIYLSFAISLVAGLPFSSPVHESRTMANAIFIQVCCFMATVAPITLHQIICQHVWTAYPAALLMFVLFWFVLHMNLGKLENEIIWQLHRLKMGPNLMFREFE